MNKDIKKAPDIKTGAFKAISFSIPPPLLFKEKGSGDEVLKVTLYNAKDSHPATH